MNALAIAADVFAWAVVGFVAALFVNAIKRGGITGTGLAALIGVGAAVGLTIGMVS